MDKAKIVFKEIGIALVLLVGIILAGFVLFIEKIPIAVEIPEPESYVAVDKNNYTVDINGIENAQSETVVYQSTTADLELYSDELRYITGKTEPLTGGNSGISDIPTDTISKKNTQETTKEQTTQVDDETSKATE